MEALVLKRSVRGRDQQALKRYGEYTMEYERDIVPSRVMPGFLGTPAGMRTISAPVRASFKPLASGW